MDESSAFYSITKGAVVQEWPHSSPLSLPMRHYLASKGALCHVLPRLEGAHVSGTTHMGWTNKIYLLLIWMHFVDLDRSPSFYLLHAYVHRLVWISKMISFKLKSLTTLGGSPQQQRGQALCQWMDLGLILRFFYLWWLLGIRRQGKRVKDRLGDGNWVDLLALVGYDQ